MGNGCKFSEQVSRIKSNEDIYLGTTRNIALRRFEFERSLLVRAYLPSHYSTVSVHYLYYTLSTHNYYEYIPVQRQPTTRTRTTTTAAATPTTAAITTTER
jgi:hypothetical protein